MNVNVDNYGLNLARFVEHASQHTTAAGGGDATVVRAGRGLEIRDGDHGNAVGALSLKLADAPGDKAGGFAALFRSRANKEANNTTRELFKSAVAEMFGGEDYIPENVRAAMKMNDYGKGRPLTARRILAVKAAIDKASRAECDQFFTSIQARAGSEGLVNLELPVEEGSEIRTHLFELAKCAQQYKREMGCSNEEAVEALFTISKTAREKGQSLSLEDLSELAKCALRYKRETKCSYAEAIRTLYTIPEKANEFLIRYDMWSHLRSGFVCCGYVPKNATTQEFEVLMDRLTRVAALLHLMDPFHYGIRGLETTIWVARDWANTPIATALGKNGEPRFMENVANFRYGFSLMRAFTAWVDDPRKGWRPKKDDVVFTKDNWEKCLNYLFADIANNTENLARLAKQAEEDPHAVFGPLVNRVRERIEGEDSAGKTGEERFVRRYRIFVDRVRTPIKGEDVFNPQADAAPKMSR